MVQMILVLRIYTSFQGPLSLATNHAILAFFANQYSIMDAHICQAKKPFQKAENTANILVKYGVLNKKTQMALPFAFFMFTGLFGHDGAA